MPDSQRYPLNLDLMNNVENPVVFQLEKGLILAISSILIVAKILKSIFIETPFLMTRNKKKYKGFKAAIVNRISKRNFM